ncbi:mucin-5AC [Galendromus occidentalis]|uniref:Mucin-5AC n=1 Tax=Galendromus occidentalis TaxID=34638 RepID=A0AAJ7SGR0_9ACAR|nr:mucin-5AC [Galendromus occidentalis]
MSLDRGDSGGLPRQQQQPQQQALLLPPSQTQQQHQRPQLQQRPESQQSAAVVAASSGPQKSTEERNMVPEKENAKDSNGFSAISSSSVVASEDPRQVGKEYKKWQHNELERRRKDKISAGILRLGELLPERDPRRMAKVDILCRACTYITYLRDLNERIVADKVSAVHAIMLKDMRNQIRDLEKVNSNYMRLLQKYGISLCSEPSAVASISDARKTALEKESVKDGGSDRTNAIDSVPKEGQVSSNVSSTTAPLTPKPDTMTLNSLGVNSLPLNGLLQPPLMQLGTAQGQPILMINDQTGTVLTQASNVIIPAQTQTQPIIINGPGGPRIVNAVSSATGTDLILSNGQELLVQSATDPKATIAMGGHQILSLSGASGTILLPSASGGLGLPIVSHTTSSSHGFSFVNTAAMNQAPILQTTANAAARKPILSLATNSNGKPVVTLSTLLIDNTAGSHDASAAPAAPAPVTNFREKPQTNTSVATEEDPSRKSSATLVDGTQTAVINANTINTVHAVAGDIAKNAGLKRPASTPSGSFFLMAQSTTSSSPTTSQPTVVMSSMGSKKRKTSSSNGISFESEEEKEESQIANASSTDILAQATESIFNSQPQLPGLASPPPPPKTTVAFTSHCSNQRQPTVASQGANFSAQVPAPDNTPDAFHSTSLSRNVKQQLPQPEQNPPKRVSVVASSNLPTVAVTAAIPGPTRQPLKAKTAQPAPPKSSATNIVPESIVKDSQPKQVVQISSLESPRVRVVHAMQTTDREQRLTSTPIPSTNSVVTLPSKTPVGKTRISSSVVPQEKRATTMSHASANGAVDTGTTAATATAAAAATSSTSPPTSTIATSETNTKDDEQKRAGPRTVAQALKAAAASSSLAASSASASSSSSSSTSTSLAMPTNTVPTTSHALGIPLISNSINVNTTRGSNANPLYGVQIQSAPPVSLSGLSMPTLQSSDSPNSPRLRLPPMDYRQSHGLTIPPAPSPMQNLQHPPKSQEPEMATKSINTLNQTSDKRPNSNGPKCSSLSNETGFSKSISPPSRSPRGEILSPIQSPDVNRAQQHQTQHSQQQQQQVQQQQQQQQVQQHQQQQHQQQQLCNYSAESLIGPSIVQCSLRNSSNQLNSPYSTESLLQTGGAGDTITLSSAGSPTYINKRIDHMNGNAHSTKSVVAQSMNTPYNVNYSTPTERPMYHHNSSSQSLHSTLPPPPSTATAATATASAPQQQQQSQQTSNSNVPAATATTYTPYNLDSFCNNSSLNYTSSIHHSSQNNNSNHHNFAGVNSGMNNDYFIPSRTNPTPEYGSNSLIQSSPVSQHIYQNSHSGFHSQASSSLSSDFPHPPLNLHDHSTGVLMNNFAPPVTPVPPQFLPSADKGNKQISPANIFGISVPTSKCPPSSIAGYPCDTTDVGGDNGSSGGNCNNPGGNSGNNNKPAQKTRSSQSLDSYTMMSSDSRSSSTLGGYFDFGMVGSASANAFNQCSSSSSGQKPSHQNRMWPPMATSSHAFSDGGYLFMPARSSSSVTAGHSRSTPTCLPASGYHQSVSDTTNRQHGSSSSSSGSHSQTNFNLSNIIPDIGCGPQNSGSVLPVPNGQVDSLYAGRPHPPPVPPSLSNSFLAPSRHSGSTPRSATFALFDKDFDSRNVTGIDRVSQLNF